MPFDPSVVPPQVIDAAKNRRLIPFVGAGISAQANSAFPNWRILITDLCNQLASEHRISTVEQQEIHSHLDKGEFLMAAEELRSRLPDDAYETFLSSKFNLTNVLPADIHKELFKLKPPLIMTTNYDGLLEDAYAGVYGRVPRVLTFQDAPEVQKNLHNSTRTFADHPIIFKIHGTIDKPQDIILTERDYRRVIYQSPGYRFVLSSIFITHVVLFLGFSFTDPELKLLMEQLREAFQYRNEPDYIFLPYQAGISIEEKRRRQDYAIQTIYYNATPSDHPEILEFVRHLVNFVP